MSKIKVGVVGTGYLGKLHTKLIRDIDNAELIGVYDKDITAAELVASEFKTKVFPELEIL